MYFTFGEDYFHDKGVSNYSAQDILDFKEYFSETKTNNFIINYDMTTMTTYHKMVLLIYYASTSLSTVGFGDFYPVSSPERLLTVFILLFGVMIFSYIMGEFIEILNSYKNLEASLDDGE